MSNGKHLDTLMQKFLDRGLPGASLSVTHKGNTIYEGYFGTQDLAGTKPLTGDTLFRLYSMTKPISAVCGMQQHERGVFLMDDPVYEYLPEYRHMQLSVKNADGSWHTEEAKQPILMRHLFNMNVGFYAFDGSPTQFGLQEMQKRLGGSKFQANYDHVTEIRALAEVPMQFEVGTHWQYGYGLDIMAAVVEVTSGMSLGQFMQQNLFDPLGMTETGYRFRPGWQERMVECIQRQKDGSIGLCTECLGDPLDSCHRPDAVYESASSGLISTLSDYQKFCTMLANGGVYGKERIIGRKTIDLMRQNLLTESMMKEFTNPSTNGYGYGYGVRTLVNPTAAHCGGSVGEFGWCGAAGTWMAVDPAEQLSVVFMMQEMFPNERYFQHRLRAAVNGLLN